MGCARNWGKLRRARLCSWHVRYQNKFYGQCSKAFIRLENAPEIPLEQRKRFSKLAVPIEPLVAPLDVYRAARLCFGIQNFKHI